jgi:small subunit ribosomal protein S12
MTKGLFAARLLQKNRHKYLKTKKANFVRVMQGKPQAKGIVISKYVVDAKNPCSGKRRCVKVRLCFNGRVVGAFLPKDGADKFVNEHDVVTLEGQGGVNGKSVGDLPGVNLRVFKVGKYSLRMLTKGKKIKV